MGEKVHACRLPFWRVPFGKVITCPVCGTRWVGDVVEDMVGERVPDWTRL